MNHGSSLYFFMGSCTGGTGRYTDSIYQVGFMFGSKLLGDVNRQWGLNCDCNCSCVSWHKNCFCQSIINVIIFTFDTATANWAALGFLLLWVMRSMFSLLWCYTLLFTLLNFVFELSPAITFVPPTHFRPIYLLCRFQQLNHFLFNKCTLRSFL